MVRDPKSGMMKILHVAPIIADRSNGPTNSVPALANAIALGGHQVALLSCSPNQGLLKSLSPAVVDLPRPSSYHWNPWVISSSWLDVIEKRFGIPDIVDFHSAYEPFQSALAQRLLSRGWPYIVTPRGSFQGLAQKQKPLKKIFGNMTFMDTYVKNALAIHALTQEEASEIHAMFPRQKIFVCPNGVDPALADIPLHFRPLFCECRSDHALVLGFLGRVDVWHKGIDVLLEALIALQEKDASLDVRLFIIGAFHTKKDEKVVADLHRRMRHPEWLLLCGAMTGEEKWRRLLGCDVFVHTSRFEGMPNAVLEAMALGKPCLVTPGTNMQSVIAQCNSGWNCDVNPESIMQALYAIDRDRLDISRRGHNAMEYVRKYLTWDVVAADYIKQVKAIIS